MRKDLNMRKGKMVAQGAHASLKVFFDKRASGRIARFLIRLLEKVLKQPVLVFPIDMYERQWYLGRFKKICLGIDSELEMIKMYAKAQERGIPCSMIIDSGLTEFGGVPTRTCIAIGPADPAEIDKITGGLKPL